MNSLAKLRPQVMAMSAAFIAAVGVSASAQNIGNWIPMQQAVETAQNTVPNSTPIKAEVDNDDGPLHYEIKTFKNNVLWEVKINPEFGSVFDVDSSDGGGAQDKIAEAQSILNTSQFTLIEAIDELQQLFPNAFVIEIEIRMRNGIGVFDADLVRGPYRIDVHMRASDGAIVKQQTRLLAGSSDYYNLYVPGPGVNWSTNNLVGLVSIINTAQSEIGGRVYDIELDKISSTAYRYEVRVLRPNDTIIKAKYNARTGALLSQQAITDPQTVNKVKNSANNAVLTLKQAIARAKTVVPNGTVTEASLQIGDNKRRYEIEFLTPSGFVEVKVNSLTGVITSIQFGDDD